MGKNENINLKRYIYPNVHSIIPYNNQDMEATQVSINRQMDKKKDEVYIYNGMLAIKKTEILLLTAM